MKNLIIFIFVFVISLGLLLSCELNVEEIDWQNIILGNILPTPQSNLMEINSNDDEWLSVGVHGISQNSFLEYQRWCKEEKGFTIDTKSSNESFNAYNEEGYRLSLYYEEDKYVMHIDLYIPIILSEYTIPEYAISAGLPLPESNLGCYKWEDEESFALLVGNTDINGYNKYKESVISAGFNIDSYDTESYYSGNNSEGYYVHIGYEGFNTIRIEFSLPEKDENEPITSYESELIDNPSGAYIIACLNATPNITDCVSIGADDGGILGAKNGCYETIYFSVDLIKQDEISGSTLAEKGTDAGGCIEAYKTVKDAESRNEYLSNFDGSYFLNSGYHKVVGTLVIRTSEKLSEKEQAMIEANIISTLTSGEIEEPITSEDTTETETKEIEKTEENKPIIQNLTVDNCDELAALVKLKNPADPSVSAFSEKYRGRIIEFDGCIQNMQRHGDYKTRWDVLLGCGDFDYNSAKGPNFKLTDVNYYDMGLDDTLSYGDNVHIVARVGKYNSATELFELDIIQVTHR